MSISFATSRYLSIPQFIGSILSFCTIFSYLGASQTPVFQHLDIRNGLSQNTVTSIIQDKQGFMWIGTPEGLNRYDSQEFRVYHHDPKKTNSLSSEWVTCSLYDTRHTLWIATYEGLNKYDPKTDSFQQIHHSADQSSLSHDHIICMFLDHLGRIWVGTEQGLNLLTDPATGRFKRYTFPGPTNHINTICEDHQGNLWVGTNDGLLRMTFANNSTHYKIYRHTHGIINSLSENAVTALAMDANHLIWAGTQHGELDRFNSTDESFAHYRQAISNKVASGHEEIIYMIADKHGDLWIGTVDGLVWMQTAYTRFTRYQNDPENPKGLSDNSIFSIFQNNQGSIWIGTYYNGLNILHPDNTPFKVLKINPSSKSLSFRTVSQITEDHKHNLWIGSDGAGIAYINRKTGVITHYGDKTEQKKSLPSLQTKAIYVDKAGNTWVGMRRGGLGRLDPDHQKWVFYRHNPSDSSSIQSDNIYSLLEDRQLRLWVLTDKGISVFNNQQGVLEPLNFSGHKARQIDSLRGYTILEDRWNNKWVGRNGGTYLISDKSDRLIWLPFTKNTTILSQYIYVIHQDQQGRIWVGTRRDGLKRFDEGQHKFVNYTVADGLWASKIVSIQSDKRGILWLGTDQGLVRFDPNRKMSLLYTASDGIPGSEFESNSSFRSQDGTLYFGTNNGLIYFNPDAIRINEQTPATVFTSLEVGNQPVKIGDASKLLDNDINLTEQLTFAHWQNFFTINFTVLNYIKSEKNRFAYKLEGIDTEWHDTRTPSVTFNNLPSGHYTLLVKGANNDGVWSKKPAQIGIVILPPFWKTWWAYCFYVFVFFVVLYSILRSFWLRTTIRREQELHQAKLDFFTNISHEIRTHLTLIIGPIDLLLLTKKEDKDVQTQLTYAKNSSTSLLNLVTELLDFRKAEAKKLPLHIAQTELISFIKNILISFQYESKKRNITLSFTSNNNLIQLWLDPDQFAKVIYNLLSNAFKFIHDGGEIAVNVHEDLNLVKISISDNGKGISEENIKKLFVNYFQVYDFDSQNTGYGIGLALAKTITELHHGTLTVESREAKPDLPGYTRFSIVLLKGNNHFREEPLPNQPTNPKNQIGKPYLRAF